MTPAAPSRGPSGGEEQHTQTQGQLRFDIALRANVQSRDGSITKGALMRNGFVEKEGTAGVAYQRPGLGSRTPALATGAGLGMLPVGTGLYGFYFPTGGTTTSGLV